jgi:hypothetical protein
MCVRRISLKLNNLGALGSYRAQQSMIYFVKMKLLYLKRGQSLISTMAPANNITRKIIYITKKSVLVDVITKSCMQQIKWNYFNFWVVFEEGSGGSPKILITLLEIPKKVQT